MELDIGLLKSNLVSLKSKLIGVHGSNKLSFNRLIKELDFLSGLDISYVVYHDDFFRQIRNSLKLLKDYDFTILLENYTIKDHNEFNELYLDLKKELRGLKKCVDTGHVNMSHDKNLENWIDKDVEVIHLNNNFGQDTHNSIYNGEIDFREVNNILKKGRCISLEVNKSYGTYLKNIEYMIKFGLVPFDNVDVALNHPIMQEKFIREVRSLLKKVFKDNLFCSFIYGSFVRKKMNMESDIDLMIILKSKTAKISFFHNDYVKLCADYNVRLDQKYPFEVFLKNDVNEYLSPDNIEIDYKNIDDVQELFFAFLDNNIFVKGKKRNYLKYRKEITQKLLGANKIGNEAYNKSELKEIVKKYVLSQQQHI
ncbi:MAG: hypothetical protein CEN87_670 [Parcubacteria group bacterium Licking1014_1]|nr:MAG: hypothetical protein CEN87_670 [Parcubacteria group bacterium Licking1014_1]